METVVGGRRLTAPIFLLPPVPTKKNAADPERFSQRAAMIVLLIYLTVAALALAIEAMFGFVFPVVLMVLVPVLGAAVLYFLFTVVRAPERIWLARHGLMACVFAMAGLIGAGYAVSHARMECARVLSGNHNGGHELSPCSISEGFVYEKVSYSGIKKTWSVTLYGRSIGFYSEENETWEFAHDQYIQRAVAKVFS
jgi:hypothetical protein